MKFEMQLNYFSCRARNSCNHLAEEEEEEKEKKTVLSCVDLFCEMWAYKLMRESLFIQQGSLCVCVYHFQDRTHML